MGKPGRPNKIRIQKRDQTPLSPALRRPFMPTTMDCVHSIKATVQANHDVIRLDTVPQDEWFMSPPNKIRQVPYEDIAAHADKEYEKSMTVDARYVTHKCDMSEKLKRWILNTPDADLAQMLDTTIAGCEGTAAAPAFEFTPMQRLMMYVYSNFPVTCTASVCVGEDQIRQLTDGRSTRRIPIEASRTLLQGSLLDVGIFNGPTASGKTAMSLCISAMALRHDNFPNMIAEYRAKRMGQVFDGIPDLPVARLAIVAVGASVFDHFVTTMQRLKPHMERCMQATVEIWTQVGKKTSVQIAGERPPNVVVYWFIPIKKLGEVLRQSPKMAVGFVICDEFVVDPPRVRYLTSNSPVLKYIVPIATPQDLQSATSGKSFLSEFFQGKFETPRRLVDLVRYCHFTDAQRAANHLCQLDLSTLTPFRQWLRHDLKALVPIALQVVFVKSKRCTLSSFLLRSDADLLPASPQNVIFSLLNKYHLDDDSNVRISNAFADQTINFRALDAALATAVSSIGTPNCHYQNEFKDVIARIRARLDEFKMECPVCMGPTADVDPCVFSCCGYLVCNSCFNRVQSTCFFCRAPVRNHVPREAVPTFAAATSHHHGSGSDIVDDNNQPPFEDDDFCVEVRGNTNRRSSQLENLVKTFETLHRHNKTRVLMVVNSDATMRRMREAEGATLDAIRNTGFRAVVVDNMLEGKGRDFGGFKSHFDSDDPTPMAMCCFTMNSKLLTGTNLDRVQAFVTVGSIPDKVLTQALGRIFRPLASRDNTVPFPMVRIYS